MAKFNFRFAVAGPNSSRSSVWHLRRHGSQLYVIFDGIGGAQKYSFHTPNICRLAFTKEYAALVGLRDRCVHEWRRDTTPEAGKGKVVRVLRIWFSTNTLSTSYPVSRKQVHEIPAAPQDWSTAIDIAFTREPESFLRNAILESDSSYNQQLLIYDKLDNGEAVTLSTYWAAVANDSLDMPAPAKPETSRFGHLVVSKNDPHVTGRPIRVNIFSNPKDGDFIQTWEMGAYEKYPATRNVPSEFVQGD